MKNPTFFLTVICLFTSHATAALTPEQKTDFLRVYGGWNYSGVIYSHPDNPMIEVLFFDINGDGVKEAIATSNNATNLEDNRGVKWDILALTKDGWERVKEIDNQESSRSLSGWLFANNFEFFELTEDGKPSQLVVIHDGRRATKIIIDEDGYLSLKRFPSLNLFSSLRKLERLTHETYTDIPPSNQLEEMDRPPPVFFEKTDLEVEPWIDDPSVIPAPSNGVWNPERERYYTDFNNDGISDLLLGVHRDWRYTLYLGNAEGKYKKYAVFHGLAHFSVENKEKGTALFWRHLWDADTLQFGYHTITDKGISDYTTSKTLKKEENGWERLWQAYAELRKESNAKELYYGLDREYSETLKEKVIWRSGAYARWAGTEDEEESSVDESGEEPLVVVSTEVQAVEQVPPVATAEQEGVAQVSPSNREREEKLGIGDKESRIEKQETPNRLWLAILPFILAILYLMRKKKP